MPGIPVWRTTHVPPLAHASFVQSSTSISQCSPSKPGRHSHRKPRAELDEMHLAWCWQGLRAREQ